MRFYTEVASAAAAARILGADRAQDDQMRSRSR